METKYTQMISDYLSVTGSLSELVSSLSEDELNKIPNDESWSIRHVLSHLLDSEIVGITRMRQVIAEDNPDLMVYDQNSWAQNLNYDKEPVHETLTLFQLLRNYQARLLYSVPDDVWIKKGHHAERGDMTLTDLLKLYTRHGQTHLAQIERILARVRKHANS